MARIVQSLTQPLEEYDQQIQQSFVRDVDSVTPCCFLANDTSPIAMIKSRTLIETIHIITSP